MTELTDDRIQELFSDLRAGQLHLVRPPGATVARTTVRRRRVTSVAAAVTVLAAVGASVVVVRPALLPGYAPAGGQREAGEVDNRAYDALPPIVNDPLGEQSPITRQTGPVDGDGAPHTIPAADYAEPHRVVPSIYTIDLTCVGDGTAVLSVMFMPVKSKADPQPDTDKATELRAVNVPCSAAPVRTSVLLSNAIDGYFRIDARADGDLAPGAAYAYSITRTQPSNAEVRGNLRSAYETLAAAHPEVPASEWGSYFDPTGTVAFYVPAKHGYTPATKRQIKVVCVGSGNLTIVMAPKRTSPVRERISCGTEPKIRTFPVVAPGGDDSFAVQIDAAGRDRAAYALLVPRPEGY